MANIKRMVWEKEGELNSSEKAIISYIFANPEQTSRLSLNKLAKKLFVSESAIFRLCKKIGLSGYSELRFELGELAAESKIKQVDIVGELSAAQQDALKYFKTLDLKDFFSDLKEAGTVYIYSTGWQQELLAQYLAHNLFITGKQATILPSAIDELKMVSDQSKKGDMLIVISYSGNNEAIRKEIKKIRLFNDKFVTVSFTTLRPGKLVSLVDYSFFFQTFDFSKKIKTPTEKNAFSPAYTFIDLLTGTYYGWLNEEKEQSDGNFK